jgi:hypothetical protein
MVDEQARKKGSMMIKTITGFVDLNDGKLYYEIAGDFTQVVLNFLHKLT